MHCWIHGGEENFRLMLAPMLWMRIERVLESTHIVQERTERRIHASSAHRGNHARRIYGFQILAQQMQRNIDILMHHVGFVPAHLVGDLIPSGSAQSHIRAEQQRLAAVGFVHAFAQGIVAPQAEVA